jgi:hypothetical protein
MESLRTTVRSVVAALGISASVFAAPAGVSLAAASQPYGLGIASVLPSAGAVVGVAHPVVVTFARPVTDRQTVERSLAVTSSPPMTGTFQWLGDNVVQWVPDRFWPAHSTLALSVAGRPLTVTTGPKVVGVASISDHTFTVTIDGVEAGPTSSLPAPHHRPRWGEPGVFPATMGRPAYPTPVGIYSAMGKERSVVMDSSTVGIPVNSPDGYHLTVDYAVRFTSRGLFVHAAPWAVNSLGHDTVSHGSVSLSPEDAEWYYDTVNVGDPIIIRENNVEVPTAPTISNAS